MLDFVGFEAITLIFCHTSLLPPKRDYYVSLFLLQFTVGLGVNSISWAFFPLVPTNSSKPWDPRLLLPELTSSFS